MTILRITGGIIAAAACSPAPARWSSASRCFRARSRRQAAAPEPRPEPPKLPGQPGRRAASSMPGSASTPTARSPSSPARPSSARASAPRCSRSRPKSSRSSPATIKLVTADTGRTPDEGFTAGSQSMQNSGTAIRNAAAQVREILIAEGGTALRRVAPTELKAEGKARSSAPAGARSSYGELCRGSCCMSKRSRNRS